MSAGGVPTGSHKHGTEHEASGSAPKRLHSGDVETFLHGDVVPQTPKDTEQESMTQPSNK